MDFGKLSDISTVSFALPPDAVRTGSVLAKFQGQQPATPQIYIGCPIWTCKDWLGKLYPAGAKDKDFLHYYTRQFNTIELNTTHYRIPDADTIRRWKAASTPTFRFSPKFPQQISHDNALHGVESETLAFCEAIRGLDTHLGVSFLQLPPYFTPAQLPALAHFLEKFPKDIPLAVEFRHPDWFKDSVESIEAFALLENFGVSTVITDVAGRRDVLHQRLTTPTAFIRFVGNDLHPTDYTRIEEWASRLSKWIDQGLHAIYFFVHEPENTHSPELVLYLIRQLNRRLDLQLPEPRIAAQPVQGSLF
jgi:uncharacterized protein YecE (DUF72 family)